MTTEAKETPATDATAAADTKEAGGGAGTVTEVKGAAPAAPPQGPAKAPDAAKPAGRTFGIPKARTALRTGFQQQATLIYGRPKTGKSTFASEFPGAVFLACEPGLKHLSVRQLPEDGEGFRTYQEFRDAANAIYTGDPRAEDVKMVVVDTLDALVALIEREVVLAKKVGHISEIPEKAGYSLVNAEVERVVRSMAARAQGLVLISHLGEEEVVTPLGKVTKATSSLRGKTKAFVHGYADLLLFADVVEKVGDGGVVTMESVLRTKPNVKWDAGDRSGFLPATMRLSFSEFLAAWTAGERRAKEAQAKK